MLVADGHAVSLIALDQEKPRRVRDARNRVGAVLCGLLLDASLDAEQAAELLTDAGLPVRGGIEVLALLGGSPAACSPRPTGFAAGSRPSR